MTIAVRVDTQNAGVSWASSSEGASNFPESRNRWKPTLEPEYRKIARLLTQDESPSIEAAANAIKFLQNLFDRATKLGSWYPPHITIGDTGEVVFEWWQGARKITLYFGAADAEYIKVWGTDIENEMESGSLADGWTVTSLWLWLNP
jgi:hypothetical protein